MSLPKARGDSNAPNGKADNEASTGSVAMVGFTEVPYEKFRPARSNSEIGSTKDNGGWALGQDGTSVEAYEFQPEELGGQDMSGLSKASKDQEK